MERQELIECIYEEYQQLMYHTAYQILQDNHLSEDTVHECVIRLYKAKALNIDSIFSPKTKSLVQIIAHNEACRIYAKQIKRPYRTESVLDDIQPDREDARVYVEIEDFLGTISPIYREVIVLRCYYGYDYNQIGMLLGIRKQTAKNRMVTVRKLLRQHWDGG